MAIVPIFLIPIKWVIVVILIVAVIFVGYTIINDYEYVPQDSDYGTDSVDLTYDQVVWYSSESGTKNFEVFNSKLYFNQTAMKILKNEMQKTSAKKWVFSLTTSKATQYQDKKEPMDYVFHMYIDNKEVTASSIGFNGEIWLSLPLSHSNLLNVCKVYSMDGQLMQTGTRMDLSDTNAFTVTYEMNSILEHPYILTAMILVLAALILVIVWRYLKYRRIKNQNYTNPIGARVCRQCGARIPRGMDFCPKCGCGPRE